MIIKAKLFNFNFTPGKVIQSFAEPPDILNALQSCIKG